MALTAIVVTVISACTPAVDPHATSYPWHTGIPSTTFWVGEVLDPHASDGSQVVSTYDSQWMAHYGGCDGIVAAGDCRTEARTATKGFFPQHMTPTQNPFYLDLPFDDVNNTLPRWPSGPQSCRGPTPPATPDTPPIPPSAS